MSGGCSVKGCRRESSIVYHANGLDEEYCDFHWEVKCRG